MDIEQLTENIRFDEQEKLGQLLGAWKRAERHEIKTRRAYNHFVDEMMKKYNQQ